MRRKIVKIREPVYCSPRDGWNWCMNFTTARTEVKVCLSFVYGRQFVRVWEQIDECYVSKINTVFWPINGFQWHMEVISRLWFFVLRCQGIILYVFWTTSTFRIWAEKSRLLRPLQLVNFERGRACGWSSESWIKLLSYPEEKKFLV